MLTEWIHHRRHRTRRPPSAFARTLYPTKRPPSRPRPQTNAKIGDYVGYAAWNLTTSNGTTIQSALDYAMSLPAGDETASELYPQVVAVGAAYGDPAGAYAAFMAANAGDAYPADAQFLWNQPFSDSGLVRATTATSATGGTVRSGSGAAPAVSVKGWDARGLALAVGAAAAVVLGA